MTEPTSQPAPHVPTLMTVHAHPDDEVIGTGGTMAKAVVEGRRVVLITCTRGEMGDIVVPELDTPENHRRLGEIRAAELEQAMAALGVTEWENLGYHDSDMMGRPGNRDPRTFWQANLDEAIGRLVWMVRRYRPDVMTTYNDFGGLRAPGPHPDPPRGGGRVRAGRRPGLVPGAARPGARRDRRGGGRGRPRAVGAGQALRAGDPGLGPHARSRSGWRPSASARSGARPEDATPEQLAEFEAFAARMLVPDETITAWVDVSAQLDQRWDAFRAHVTQISGENPFVRFGRDAWAEFWSREAFVRRESRVPAPDHEDDLFAGLDDATPGPYGWG